MTRDYERQRQFTRRAALFALGKSALTLTLLGRLYYLQIAQGEKYSLLSEENRINLRLLIPPRGLILDRYGTILAENARNFRLLLTPEKTPSVQDTLDKLAKIIVIGPAERARILSEIKKRRAFAPILVNDELSWEQMAALELHNLDLPGASIEVGQNRHYPYAEMAAHALGYVAPVSDDELKKNIFGQDPLLRIPELRVGKKGLEKHYEEDLRGKAGSSQLEVNAYGRIIRELAKDEGVPGLDLPTTLDMELQKKAMTLLEGQSGAAILLDIYSGEVLVFASAPGFNPNLFNNGISIADWEDLLSNPRTPLTNKALAGMYAPGSTFKIVTALSALEYGVMDADDHVYCDGHRELGKAIFHCWKKGGHGSLDMVGAIRESCDLYFYEAANRLGIDRLAQTARKCGLAAATGIDLPGEKSGLIPDRLWKQQRFKKPWTKGETLIAGIGQGYVLSTPLQLARFTALMLNGNRPVQPFLRQKPKEENIQPPSDPPDPLFRRQHLAVIKQAMDEVTMHPSGTAFAARIKAGGMEMGGKTGTSQVRRISLAERARGIVKNEHRPWRERDHALFIGYAPLAQPKYAVAVVVEHGGGGSAVAAPIARDLLLAAQLRLGSENTPAAPANIKAAPADNADSARHPDEEVISD
jgi:penicillin-binding protein 2